ncbi:hypothetical protein [Roseateles koreensis]|uniref:Uncharacterized protein n=1 Tax=Roseateles koreensis TaxID=2987526 RepID=A0ABT5KWI3_9BURK|nr:hypothetical protein [Roseateles koreensis]MDC8787289.1 hypothetical protein [Roseateles koreensis]
MKTEAQRIEVELFERPLEQIANYCEEFCSAELLKLNKNGTEWDYLVLRDGSAIAMNWANYEMQINSKDEVDEAKRNDKLNTQKIVEQNRVQIDLMPAADLREMLFNKISSIDAVLTETWRWTGRTREIIMRVDRDDINLARVTYPSNSGRKPTGIEGMKTGGRKYFACAELLAQLQSTTVLYN